MDLFKDVIASLNDKRDNLIHNPETEDAARKSYSAYIVNKNFSQMRETLALADLANNQTFAKLPVDMQYDFWYYSIPKGKRWGKWEKSETDEKLFAIFAKFGYNRQRATEFIALLSPETIAEIKKKYATNEE